MKLGIEMKENKKKNEKDEAKEAWCVHVSCSSRTGQRDGWTDCMR